MTTQTITAYKVLDRKRGFVGYVSENLYKTAKSLLLFVPNGLSYGVRRETLQVVAGPTLVSVRVPGGAK